MRVAVIFPGQGNQTSGFGRSWAGSAAWEVVSAAEAAVRQPLADLLLDAGPERLSRTREAQLSVLLSSLVVWGAVEACLLDGGHEVVGFGGHSLGQITALAAGGAVDPGTGARVALLRAELTQAEADRHPGRMVALLGAVDADVDDICRAAHGCWPANYNAPGQVVIAGTPAGVEQAVARAAEIGIDDVVWLEVAGAFHTPLMAKAADAFAEELATVDFAPTPVPIVSNTDGQAYTDGRGWPLRLREQLVRPVLWRACMETLAALEPDLVLEVGPGTTLKRLAKRVCPGTPVRSVATPEDVAALGSQLRARHLATP